MRPGSPPTRSRSPASAPRSTPSWPRRRSSRPRCAPGPTCSRPGSASTDGGAAPLEIGDAKLRGRIDRIDLSPDGSAALVRDYKTGKEVAGAQDVGTPGKAPASALHPRRPRTARAEPGRGPLHRARLLRDRRPRGILLEDDPRLGELPTVGGDPCDAEPSSRSSSSARSLAAAKAAAMRAGEIDRDPIDGRCPTYCTFQPICRLERAIGLEEDTERRAAARTDRADEREPVDTGAARSRSIPATATSSARPAPEPARRGSWSTATATPSSSTSVGIEAILAFTFTERAAAELRSRIRLELGRRAARGARERASRARRSARARRSRDRARLGDDDPRFLPPAARDAPGRRRDRSAFPRPRRERGRRGFGAARATRRSPTSQTRSRARSR